MRWNENLTWIDFSLNISVSDLSWADPKAGVWTSMGMSSRDEMEEQRTHQNFPLLPVSISLRK